MGLLDAYDTFVNNRCNELTLQNNTVQKLTESSGLANIVGGVEDSISKGVVESLKDSPLRELAEDVLAQTITNNAKRLSQNVMNQIPGKLTETLTDIRSTAFNAVFTTLTFKNDLVLYFASVVAEQAVEAIRDKRRTLISLQESVRKLHNALLTIAGGGPIFNEYLRDLRLALVRLDEAEVQLAIVSSAFRTNNIFSQASFSRAKELLSEAHSLIVPPVTGEDAEELKEGFLNAVFEATGYGRTLSMLQSIPQLTKQMLGNYDLYAAKVVKVNTLLLGFQSTVQNLKQVTGGGFKDTILSHLDDARVSINDIMEDMSRQLNGSATANEPLLTDRGLFKPNPTSTASRAIGWGVRVKSVEIMLQSVDADALQKLNLSNSVLNLYNRSLQELSELDDRVTNLAILRATDGREQPGDIEGSFIQFAFQANQAIVDSALTAGQAGSFDSRQVVALGRQVDERLQLSIDQDREVEKILLRYIKAAEPLLKGVKQLGDSVFGLLDNLGMDRASDFLKRGSFGEFFSMSGRTSTYLGAAVTSLSAINQLVDTEQQRTCIENTINQIKVRETSKRLAVQRAVSTNYVKQQKRNTEECEELKKDREKTEACTVGLNIDTLRDNPVNSIFGALRGIFGGDVADSLSSTTLGTGLQEIGKNNPSLGGVINFSSNGFEDVSGVFSNANFASIAAKEASQAASTATGQAKSALKSALTSVGIEASEDEELSDLEQKANVALERDQDDNGLSDAITESRIAQETIKEARSLSLNSSKTKNAFGKFVS